MAEPGPWRARRIRASWSSVALAVLAIAVAFIARNVFIAASQPIGWVVASGAVALVLAPVIEVQARWIPRPLAMVLTLLAVVAFTLTIGAGVVVEVQDQLTDLQQRLPAAAERLERRSGPGSVVDQIGLGSLVADVVEQTGERVVPSSTIGKAVGTAPAFVVSGVLVIFFLVWGDELFEGLQRQIGDRRRREEGSRVLQHAVRLTQRYVLAATGLSLVVAVLAGALARGVGLSTPLVLGVVVGVASLVPRIGILFGAVPVLLLSAASQSSATTLVLLAAFVAGQAGHTVALRSVERRTLTVGPAVVVVAALLGSDLYGVGGALVAVIAGVLATSALEAWRPEADAAAEPASISG